MSFAERRNNLGKCWWLNVFPLVVCSLSSFAQPRYLCEYGAADNLLLSAPAAGGLPGLSPIVHDAPSGKVLRAGDKAYGGSVCQDSLGPLSKKFLPSFRGLDWLRSQSPRSALFRA